MIIYKSLIRELEKARKGLISIIEDVNSGDAEAVKSLDQNIFSEHNKELFLINAQQMKDRVRYSGDPFFIHPASASWLFSYFVKHNRALRKATAGMEEQIIGYILSHDLLENALKYDKEKFFGLKRDVPAKHHDALDASVLMCSPRCFRRELEKVSDVYIVKNYGTKAHAYAMMTEKLDNLLDLKYMADDTGKEYRIAKWFISRTMFAMQELTDMCPEMVPIVNTLCEKVRKRNGIKSNIVEECKQEYYDIFEEYKEKIGIESGKHLEKYGLGRLIDSA